MKKSLYIAFALLSFCFNSYAATPDLIFSGNSSPVIRVDPDKSTGLNQIYVAQSLQGLNIIAPPFNGKPLLSWQYFDNRGGAFATDVEGLLRNDNNTTLTMPMPDTGYILEWPDAKIYIWLTDYSAHQLQLKELQLPVEQDCSTTTLSLLGQGDAIHYYTINGRQMTLERQIKIAYQTLQWDADKLQYQQIEASTQVESIGQIFISPTPLCNTSFTATGDRFLQIWNAIQEVQSPPWQTNAVEAQTSAEQTNKPGENSNQIGVGQNNGSLGGSAPADISFRAYISDALIHSEWQFSTDPEFNNITHRFNQQDLDYSFQDEGTTFIRFVGSNNNGSCTCQSQTYTVNIGASELHCPNAFSPGASEGVNDEWKVSYRSLIKFQCYIFDRYGTQLFNTDNPEQGWDGKYRGKLVSPGVYFYVIEALGADGKKYKKGGDINILRYNPGDSSNNPPSK